MLPFVIPCHAISYNLPHTMLSRGILLHGMLSYVWHLLISYLVVFYLKLFILSYAITCNLILY